MNEFYMNRVKTFLIVRYNKGLTKAKKNVN